MDNDDGIFKSVKKKLRNKMVDVRYCFDSMVLKKYQKIGYNYINKAMTDNDYTALCKKLYGNQYLEEKYSDNITKHLEVKYWLADLILHALPSIKNVCDAGANKGYLMKAFKDRGINAYGFDILENKEIVLADVRENFKIGSILNIPKFDKNFDVVTSIDVFEHIPINMVDKMVQELKNINPQYFVLQISKDILNDGHITIKDTKFWVNKFRPEYEVMHELYGKLIKYRTLGNEQYCNVGIPRNDFNKCPGIIFLKKRVRPQT